MKKLGLGVLAIVAIAATYYFTVGETKLTNEMKVRVNQELLVAEKSGFLIEERKIEKKKEHFIISFNDADKIKTFFEKQGQDIDIEEAKSLIGLKVGVDLQYLSSALSAVSADVYPLNLPTTISTTKDLNSEDKVMITHLNDMLKRKALLLHIDFNKLLTSFDGYIQDIHESVKLENLVKLDATGMLFKGNIKDKKLNSTSNSIKNISLKSGDDLNIVLNDAKSHYKSTGSSMYDTNYNYSIKTVNINTKKDNKIFSMALSGLDSENNTAIKNNLTSNSSKLQIANIQYIKNGTDIKFIDTSFAFNLINLDMNILEKFNAIDIENVKERNKLTQELISKGIALEIPKIEVKKLVYQGKKIDAFNISSSLSIKKSADLTKIQENPFAIIDAINSKTKITVSDDFFTILAEQPQIMLFAMMIKPQVVNGKKVYEIELKDGKVLVNGKGVM